MQLDQLPTAARKAQPRPGGRAENWPKTMVNDGKIPEDIADIAAMMMAKHVLDMISCIEKHVLTCSVVSNVLSIILFSVSITRT